MGNGECGMGSEERGVEKVVRVSHSPRPAVSFVEPGEGRGEGESTLGISIDSLNHATIRHIEAALQQTQGRIEGPRGPQNCSASIRTRCGRECES